MFQIRIMLSLDRAIPGVLHLFGPQGRYLRSWSCLAKADNERAAAEGNPERHPTLPYGDTPTGTYAPARVQATGAKAAKLGPFWIPLIGTGANDDARCARPGLGVRTGLGIHAGRGNDHLVPTHGCVRLLQSSMDDLCAYIGTDQVLVKVEALE
jgi:hypothetical protein